MWIYGGLTMKGTSMFSFFKGDGGREGINIVLNTPGSGLYKWNILLSPLFLILINIQFLICGSIVMKLEFGEMFPLLSLLFTLLSYLMLFVG